MGLDLSHVPPIVVDLEGALLEFAVAVVWERHWAVAAAAAAHFAAEAFKAAVKSASAVYIAAL